MSDFVANLFGSLDDHRDIDDVIRTHRVIFKDRSIFFSLDVETNGPDHDLLCGGIVAFDHQGKELGAHRFSITPQTQGKPATMKWLQSQTLEDPNFGPVSVYDNALRDAKPAQEAMQEATNWCMNTLNNHGATTGYLVCFPSAFDGRFWTNYCERYNVNGYQSFLAYFPKARVDPDQGNYRDPFGFNHIDGQTFAMAQLKLPERLPLKALRSLCFTDKEMREFDMVAHDAVHDARMQGQLFFRLANLDLVELRHQ